MKIDKSKLDISAIFLAYMATVGCPERTALAMGLDPALVTELAKSEGWDLKLKRISVLSKSEKPGDFYRAQNRCVNWVMAHQLRVLLSKIMDSFKDDTPEQIIEKLGTQMKSGEIHLSARFLSDLCKLETERDRVNSTRYPHLEEALGQIERYGMPPGVCESITSNE